MADNQFGADEIRVHVGDQVQMSDDVADALENLATTLSNEVEGDDDVVGFSFHQSDDLFMMMMGGGGGGMMGPTVGVEGDDKIGVGVSGGCALDIVVKVPTIM